MNWPQKIIIRFFSNENPVSNLLVFVSAKSSLKNDFSLNPVLSNTDGIIILSKAEIINCIQNSKQDYPMDYDGEIENCNALEIIVEDVKDLKKRIQRLKKYYPENAKLISKLVLGCNNLHFQSLSETFQVPIKDVLSIELKVKS